MFAGWWNREDQRARVDRRGRGLELVERFGSGRPGPHRVEAVEASRCRVPPPGATPPAANHGANRGLHGLVEEQARRTPEASAVVEGERTLSYGALDDRADRLARSLRAFGVGPDVPVGICLERSLELAVAALGVLKAGGACLPLDATYPQARLAFMLEDAGAPVVLTRASLRGRVPSRGAEVVALDDDSEAIEDHARPLESAPVTTDQLAYVIYTSGSTGRPKGVMLTHGGLVNHSLAASRLYRLTGADRVLQFCSISFDVSVEELFTTWASGATVVARPDGISILGRGWLEWLRANRVTALNLPTAYWHAWVRDLHRMDETVPENVRLTVVGGERALGTVYRQWLQVGGDRVRWLNAYGPSEASVMSTVHEPAGGGGREHDDRDPPIGRPIANTTVHVLDDRGRPAAVGAAAELHIGGLGLARGYINRPELTASRFVPDPFSCRRGARLYRTGDLVRQRPDGELEFVGRLDDQVKVRGHRIECAEVEAALATHPDVEHALVTARADVRGDERLVAYVVASGGRAGAAELRRFLSDRLPGYMVPTTFIGLDEIRLGPNGKVDRDSLPVPAPARADLGKASRLPRTMAEAAMAAIWSRVLGVDDVGVEDDFFELGGHSLLGTQVIAQVRETFGVDVPLHDLFEATTVAGLAVAVEARGGTVKGPGPTGRPSDLRPLPRSPGRRIPLSLPQQQMWRLEVQAEPQGLYNVTACHRFPFAMDQSALHRALAFMTERHEMLRACFPLEDGVPHQVISPSVSVEVVVSALTAMPVPRREQELSRLIGEEDAKPFDLSSAPLLRAHVLLLDDDNSVLAVTFDHLVCDGTSAYVFLAEVVAAYDALVAGRPVDLPALEVQYADFAIWQRRLATDERLQAQLDYWKEKLAGMPLGPAVPFDRLPETPTRRIAKRPFGVPPDTYRGLESLARATRSTVFVVCAAATSGIFSRFGGLTDILLSTTLSGRQRAELEGLIGMFAGMSRIRTDLSGNPAFEEVVERTRDTVMGMFENQDIPFMRVRRTVAPDFPTGGLELSSSLPNELAYFRIAHHRRRPGTAFVEGGADHLWFRGQLHPLSVTFLDDGDALWGEISCKLDFYTEATIEALALAFERVLAAASTNPSLRLDDLFC